MNSPSRDHSLGEGVYFAKSDYASITRRVIIAVIDSMVLLTMILFVLVAWVIVLGSPTPMLMLQLSAFIWLYAVALKRSSIGTLGYLITGCKLVTLQGEKPSLSRVTFHSLLWLYWPFNFLYDMIWCGIDEDRQSIRDRYAGLCLVRNHAQPLGSGEVHLSHFFAYGYSLTYPRVIHPKTIAA